MSNIVEDRQIHNRMICDLLIAAVERYPDWRFGQILRNLEIITEIRENDRPIVWSNGFNEESADLLSRIDKYEEVMKSLGARVDNNTRAAVKRLKIYKNKYQKDI